MQIVFPPGCRRTRRDAHSSPSSTGRPSGSPRCPNKVCGRRGSRTSTFPSGIAPRFRAGPGPQKLASQPLTTEAASGSASLSSAPRCRSPAGRSSALGGRCGRRHGRGTEASADRGWRDRRGRRRRPPSLILPLCRRTREWTPAQRPELLAGETGPPAGTPELPAGRRGSGRDAGATGGEAGHRQGRRSYWQGGGAPAGTPELLAGRRGSGRDAGATGGEAGLRQGRGVPAGTPELLAGRRGSGRDAGATGGEAGRRQGTPELLAGTRGSGRDAGATGGDAGLRQGRRSYWRGGGVDAGTEAGATRSRPKTRRCCGIPRASAAASPWPRWASWRTAPGAACGPSPSPRP